MKPSNKVRATKTGSTKPSNATAASSQGQRNAGGPASKYSSNFTGLEAFRESFYLGKSANTRIRFRAHLILG